MLTKFNRSFKFAEIRQILRKIRKRIGRQQGAAPPNMFENLHGPNMHSFSYQLRSACGRSPRRLGDRWVLLKAARLGLTFSADILRGKTKVFFRSAPRARSPRAATHDSRLAEKFVDFEEL